MNDATNGNGSGNGPGEGAPGPAVRELPDYGFVRFRKAEEAESHSWQPATVRASIRELMELHARKTGSMRAGWLLDDWENEARNFVRLTPRPQA